MNTNPNSERQLKKLATIRELRVKNARSEWISARQKLNCTRTTLSQTEAMLDSANSLLRVELKKIPSNSVSIKTLCQRECYNASLSVEIKLKENKIVLAREQVEIDIGQVDDALKNIRHLQLKQEALKLPLKKYHRANIQRKKQQEEALNEDLSNAPRQRLGSIVGAVSGAIT
ncbi:MAG: hypothetical protein JKY67_20640 [Pseudomonadales bacterium]|nr:hypothetical protein [Pseudomonadales bacterium]